jgi:hypothetical protein
MLVLLAKAGSSTSNMAWVPTVVTVKLDVVGVNVRRVVLNNPVAGKKVCANDTSGFVRLGSVAADVLGCVTGMITLSAPVKLTLICSVSAIVNYPRRIGARGCCPCRCL